MLILLLSFVFTTCKDKETTFHREPWDDTPAFWIWNQTTPWTPHPSLHYYLQVAEFTATSHREFQAPPPGPNTTPVVRLPAGRATLEDPKFTRRFLHWAQSFLAKNPHTRLQLDYDCSTSTLGYYAKFLVDLRQQLKLDHLSVTALASWIDAPDFDKLCQSVDELAPMFYDLEVDQPASIRANTPLALVSPETLSWIHKWNQCPVTWRAGLPNFQRLSLFESSGQLVGHLQRWSPSHLSRISGLTPLPRKAPNALTFKITRETQYHGVTMKPGQLLIWRAPGEVETLRALATAQAAGASGIIWFAHPDSAPVAWHSIAHLSALQNGAPALANLRHEILPDGSVTLTNDGPGDLSFRPGDPPRLLILEASAQNTFAPGDPGTFLDIAAPGSSLVRPELARTITLSFNDLHSGKSLTSGPGLIKSPTTHPPTLRIHPQPPSPRNASSYSSRSSSPADRFSIKPHPPSPTTPSAPPPKDGSKCWKPTSPAFNKPAPT
ncbi:DUF3142 domain-containing protein [Verrucomicrobiaceae bacterium 227]